MQHFTRFVCFTAIVAGFTISSARNADAQYPVYAVPVQTAVVGYQAQRRGLFGQRVVFRPVVAPVAAVASVAPVAVARPVVPVTSFYAPPVAVPVSAYRVPVSAYRVPVSAYRVPVSAYRVPVSAYRVPVAPYVPVYGF